MGRVRRKICSAFSWNDGECGEAIQAGTRKPSGTEQTGMLRPRAGGTADGESVPSIFHRDAGLRSQTADQRKHTGAVPEKDHDGDAAGSK